MKLCFGALLILLGAMPVTGYLGFLLVPGDFHQDAFVGTVWHLAAGVAPTGAGIALTAFSNASAKQILASFLAFPGGVLMAFPALLHGNGDWMWVVWLSIAMTAFMVAVAGWALVGWMRPDPRLQSAGDACNSDDC